MQNEDVQILTPVLTSDGRYMLILTYKELEEVSHALLAMKKHREAARRAQRKKAEELRKLKGCEETITGRRKVPDLLINIKPPSPPQQSLNVPVHIQVQS